MIAELVASLFRATTQHAGPQIVSIFHLKRASDDQSLEVPQNPPDAPCLQNRRVTIMKYEKI
jgi:hypothetical protein